MKILVVDDDFLVRIALKTLINWEEYGFELVGEAEDGNQAVEMIKTLKPDIVLLDIQMPIMNGIEVLKWIKSLSKPPAVIVLSSHDDFHLVKETLQLGAMDYIRKLDINYDSIVEVLETASAKIKENELLTQDEEDIHQKENHIVLLRRTFFENLLGNFYEDREKLIRDSEILGIPIDCIHNYCFIVFPYDLMFADYMQTSQILITKHALTHISEELVNGKLRSFCFEWMKGQFIIISMPKDGKEDLEKEDLLYYGEQLVSMLYEYLNLNVLVGIGKGGRGAEGIQDALKSAEDALKKRYLKGDKKVFLWTDESSIIEENKNSFSVFDYKDDLIRGIDMCSMFETNIILDRISEGLFSDIDDKNSINRNIDKVFYMVSEYFETSGMKVQEILKKCFAGYDTIMQLTNKLAIYEFIEALKVDLSEYCKSIDKGDLNQRMLSVAKKYIEQHFMEDISLSDVARHVNLNPSYFSNLLKKDCGKSYQDFLIDLRIEEAKKLIRTSNYKIYEISELVGYPNTFYFTRLFKRRTGVTPSEYKKMERTVL